MIVCFNENLKILMKPQERKYKFFYYFLCASISGSIASILTNPMDVIKTRLQTQSMLPGMKENIICEETVNVKYKNFKSTAIQMYRQEGAKAFIKGIVPRAMQASLSSALSWVSYEFIKHHLLHKI